MATKTTSARKPGKKTSSKTPLSWVRSLRPFTKKNLCLYWSRPVRFLYVGHGSSCSLRWMILMLRTFACSTWVASTRTSMTWYTSATWRLHMSASSSVTHFPSKKLRNRSVRSWTSSIRMTLQTVGSSAATSTRTCWGVLTRPSMPSRKMITLTCNPTTWRTCASTQSFQMSWTLLTWCSFPVSFSNANSSFTGISVVWWPRSCLTCTSASQSFSRMTRMP